jgi:hypothetical protein
MCLLSAGRRTHQNISILTLLTYTLSFTADPAFTIFLILTLLPLGTDQWEAIHCPVAGQKTPTSGYHVME